MRQETDSLFAFFQDYLPLEVNGEVKGEQPKITESVVAASEEHKDIIEVTCPGGFFNRNILLLLWWLFLMDN